jgi:hypothetical protein
MRKVAVGLVVLLWLGGSAWAVWHYYDTTPTSPRPSSVDSNKGAADPAAKSVIVPDVVGSEAMPAAIHLQKKELGVTIVRSPSVAVPERIVIEQDPAAGTEVPSGTVIELTISTGAP